MMGHMLSVRKDGLQGAIKKVGALPIVILIMAIFTQLNNPSFFTVDNLTNISLQISVNGVLSIATTLVILTGNIDLSLGSIIGLTSCVGCSVVLETGMALPGILVAMILGAICGAINGLIVVKSEIHPFVATLGTGMAFSGIAYILTGGAQVAGLPNNFLNLGSGNLMGIPYLFTADGCGVRLGVVSAKQDTVWASAL